MNLHNTPSETLVLLQNAVTKKAHSPLKKTMLLALFAGLFIGIGSEASNLVTHGIKDVGMAKTLAGMVFPTGLIMIVIFGAELFTSNCLIMISVVEKKVKFLRMLRNWMVVYGFNLIGGLIIAFGIYMTGQLRYSDNGVGAYTIKVALDKLHHGFLEAFASGIFCNILVCTAVIMATSARDIAGKCLACFFPISIFIISGFEHCIANMYYLPAGILASKNPTIVAKAMETYGFVASDFEKLNAFDMFTSNLIPVTLGNIVGGAIIAGLGFYYINREKKQAVA